MVVCVHEELIHELVESRVDVCLGRNKCIALLKEDILLCSLHRTNVGIRETEDVLAMRLLLVGLGKIHDDDTRDWFGQL
jgi:hypothetical protein